MLTRAGAGGYERSVPLRLKSLTYTSLARLDLTEDGGVAIHREAARQNALDGITGLLVFNGTHFLQILEGSDDAIEDLLQRLRRDRRHEAVEVRDERMIDQRLFGDWSMELVRVKGRYIEAREQVARALPSNLPPPVTERIFRMTEAISGTVELPG